MIFDRKWCKTFVTITAVMFLVGAVIYGALAYATYKTSDAPFYTVLIGMLAGGWLLSGIVGGIMTFVRFISNQSLQFKIICAVLFPFTYIVITMSGIFGTIFMFIYSIMFLKRTNQTT